MRQEKQTVNSNLQTDLLAWYTTNARVFPWRNTYDPYAILLAEKLLQQTAVGPPVIRAYNTLITRYPNPRALGDAQKRDLELIIRPLGFLYRADELKRLGSAITERHNGTVPNDLNDLLALPGVGDYAARAVLSFAFGQDEPIVDTNVARFLQRLFVLDGRWSNPARDRQLLRIAGKLVPVRQARNFNYAVLDLCAAVCTRLNPRCSSCPIQMSCATGLMSTAATARGQHAT